MSRGFAGAGAMLCVLLAGCSHLHSKPADKYVYCTAKQGYLHDRVAAVTNRTGEVTNGEKLVVLERAKRWVQVRTPKGEVGWIEENKTVEQRVVDQFDQLGKDNEKDPVVGSATARDEVVLHVTPGRKAEYFYRLQEGDKLSLLKRAVEEKAPAPGTAVAKVAAPATAGKAAADAPVGPVYEDWWLVRDAKGDTGWVYSHLIDVDAPESLDRYAEGQRIVGAYVLASVDDPDSGVVNNGVTMTSIPEYVTVLGPYKAGLPYDFDQVRVFTWNVKKHRYETAFREHDVAGYLPVVIAAKTDPYGKGADASTPLPSFSYQVLSDDAAIPAPDPATGELTPTKTVTKTYRLEGNICRRILQPGAPAPGEFHPAPEVDKDKKGKKKK